MEEYGTFGCTDFCLSVLEVLNCKGMFLEDSPEFFQNSRQVGDRNTVPIVCILFLYEVSLFEGLCEGPVWVTTCFEFCFEIIQFLLFPLRFGGEGFSFWRGLLQKNPTAGHTALLIPPQSNLDTVLACHWTISSDPEYPLWAKKINNRAKTN